jgi:uncharacterized protein (TIGR03437 family)
LSKLFLALALALPLCAQTLTPSAERQITALLSEKASRNAAQQKMDSHLVHAAAIVRGQAVHPDFPVPPGELEAVHADARNFVEIDIRARVTPALLAFIRSLGGSIINSFPEYQSIRASISLLKVEQLAGRKEVIQIRVADPGHSNAGPDPLGDIAHQASLARASFGFNGAGVKIGVMSDSVKSLAAEQAAGRLPNVNVLASGTSGDEGTAMLEIVYTLAPVATLYFATATGGQAAMANNIQLLLNAGCQIIVDDWTYFAEGVFQDDIVARKVNAAAAAGVFFFSDAQNSGSVRAGNSGTWEGDFLDSGGAIPAVPAIQSIGGAVHNFGSAAKVVDYDILTSYSPASFNGQYELKWSDPLTASSNDYDLFILDSTMTTVLGSSTNIQNGTQTPEEHINVNSGWPTGARIVDVKHPAAQIRAIHIDTERGILAIGTNSATFGHNAASGAFTMAAVDVESANGGSFSGGLANPSYYYGSDGPRRMFFNADGTAITPNNFLVSTNGGTVLQKPDFTAADGVSTGVPGYTTFYGTSAAGPHAAAIAALILQAKPSTTIQQMRAEFTASALDIDDPGFDINSGAGIVMAPNAVSTALGLPIAPQISAGTLLNGASFSASPLAPGSIASAYGAFGIGSATAASSLPLPTSLAGFSMKSTEGISPPLFYVSTGQVNWQVPWEFAGLPQTGLSVTVNGRTGAPQLVRVAAYSPGIFTVNSEGKGQGSIVDTAGRVVDANNPASAGSTVVSIYCTGLGPVSNPPASGAAAGANPLSATTTNPRVTVGGVAAQVLFSGLAPGLVGGYQVNILIPSTAPSGNSVPVVLSIGGAVSNTVTIAVK